MASSKEMQHASRPLAHRPSMSSSSTATMSISARQSHSRNNSHSILASSLNATHRVTRRKSMSNTATSAAAVAAVLKEAGEKAMAVPIAGARRNTLSKNSGASARLSLAGSLPSPPASLPTHKFAALDGKMDLADSAIDDELNDDASDNDDSPNKARLRRASDGQPLVKEGRKINRVELRCETCGKGYKHSSCLTKHLWEHTPEWSITSKLLISKHQQVQLLEAAAVLMTITKENTTPPDSARDFVSDQESASPPASAYSDQHEDRSSADTTPPPFDGSSNAGGGGPYRSLTKRYSSGSGFSRSYQSAPSAASILGSLPNGVFGHQRQLSHEQRPTSSGSDVAAAMELLSCSHGSSSGGGGGGGGGPRTVHLPPDAPPVPPVPAQYLDQAVLTGTSFISSFPSRIPESFTRGELRGRHHHDIKMEGSGESVSSDEDDDMQSRARSDEDDDGVFGRMEE